MNQRTNNSEELITNLQRAQDEAIDANDFAKLSVINKALEAEEGKYAGSASQIAEDARGEGTVPKGLDAMLPGFISGETTDILGLLNRAFDPMDLRGPDHGLYDYLTSAMGKSHEGEMTIPWNEVQKDKNFWEYLENARGLHQENAATELNEMQSGGVSIEDILNDPNTGDEERSRILELMEINEGRTLKSYPFLINRDDEGEVESITIKSDLLPKTHRDVDMKFTKEGRLSLPYLGTYMMDDGELKKTATSAFRVTEGLPEKVREKIPFLEKVEDYLYPNVNPSFSYGDTPGETAGYFAGQMISPAHWLLKGATSVPSAYRGIKSYFSNLGKRKNAGITANRIEPTLRKNIEVILN